MYETFYGLDDKPFALRPDPRFFYESKGHRRAMAYLEYGIQQQEGFIVITGEVGAGKTTLVRNLFAGIDDRPLVAAQLVSTQLNADTLLRSVNLAFGLEDAPQDKALQLRQLERFLLRTRQRGQRALLVVDEAQNLSNEAVEELRMLSNFQGEDGPLLQSFLLGQPEFRRILRSANMQQLRQRVIATYHLGPMDEADTRAYIEHRLSRVGWQGDPSFDEQSWALIHGYTAGIPRQVNTLCDRLLLMGYLEEYHHFGPAEVQAVIDEMEADLGGQGGGEEGESEGAPAGEAPHGPGLDGKLERIERYLGFNYKLIQYALEVQRGDRQRLERRLDRIERYLVSGYRLTRQVGATLRRTFGVARQEP